MSIIRTIHNKENPYVMINKTAINDNSISFKALGIWIWAMSKPTDWKFYVSQICIDRKEGKKAIYAMINELIEAGYCIRAHSREKDKTGKTERFLFTGMEYIFFESKITPEYLEDLKKSFPQLLFGDADNGDAQKEQLLKNDSKEIKKGTTNYPKESEPDKNLVSSSFEIKKLTELEEIPKISDSQKVTLYKKFSHSQILQAIKSINWDTARNNFAVLYRALENGWTARQTESEKVKESREIFKKAENFYSKLKSCPISISIDKTNAYIFKGTSTSTYPLHSEDFKEKFCNDFNKWRL